MRELMTGLSASPKSEVKAKYRNALANPDVYAAYLRLSSLCACVHSIGCSGVQCSAVQCSIGWVRESM
jgi:hypothetical protein